MENTLNRPIEVILIEADLQFVIENKYPVRFTHDQDIQLSESADKI